MANTNPLFDDLDIAPSPVTQAAADNPVMGDLGISKSKSLSENTEEKAPSAYDTLLGGNERVAGLAARAGAEGVGDIASTGAKLVHAVQDIPQWASWEMLKHMRHAFGMPELPDSPIIRSPASEFTEGPSGGDIVDPIADRAGLPKPATAGERVGSAAVRAAPSILAGDSEAAIPALLPTMAGGAASQVAAETGAGPVGQTIAGVATGLAPGGFAAGVRGLVRGGERGAATMEQNLHNAQNAGIKISAGQAADRGILKAAETTGAKVPGGGSLAETRGAGLNHQIDESVSNITKKLAPDYNQEPATPMDAGEVIQEGLKKRIEGLKNETNETADAMHSVIPKETPMSAPKFEATIKNITNPTGIQAVDDLVTSSKTKAIAKVADKVVGQPKNPTSYHADGEGSHVVTSPNGETHAVETTSGDLKVIRSDTSPAAQGKGEGTDRLETLAHAATGKGVKLISDGSVSPAEAAAYEKLGRRGWVVEKNPNAEVNPNTGNTISDSPKNPVYAVRAPSTERTPNASKTTPGSEKPFGGEWTYDPKTGKSEPSVGEAPTSKPTDAVKAKLNPETPWTFDSLRQLRTSVGKELRPGISDTRQGQLKQLYGALSDDLRAGVQSKGPEAEQAYDLLNHVASQNATTQKTLVRTVRNLGGPEAVFKTAMSGSKDGATKLAPIMGSLDDEGKNLFRATVLHRLGRAGGAVNAPFDANTFLKNWKGMSPEGKNMLFGEGAGAGPPTQLRKSLDALSDSMDLLSKQGYIKSGFVKGVEKGNHGLRNVGIMGAVALLAEHSGSAMIHIATGHPFLAAGAVTGAAGILAGNPVMSRVLTNPKTVSWLAQATKAPKGMVPVLISQLNRMGERDPDARDLSNLIQQAGSDNKSASIPKQDSTQTGMSDDRPINNNHKMIPMKSPSGSTFYGVDPATFDQPRGTP